MSCHRHSTFPLCFVLKTQSDSVDIKSAQVVPDWTYYGLKSQTGAVFPWTGLENILSRLWSEST